MLYFDRTDVAERSNINKTSAWKECDICHYWYFLDKGFNFQSYICNGCHDVLMLSINLSDIPILNIHGVNYRLIISGISKSEAINLIQNIDLSKKKRNIIKPKIYCQAKKNNTLVSGNSGTCATAKRKLSI